MSAAATAAGYLYASGRLRGREKRESAEGEKPQDAQPRERPRIEKPRDEVRVAAVPAREDARPRRTPVVQYRTRRWKPNAAE
jgi:hypothetical protein